MPGIKRRKKFEMDFNVFIKIGSFIIIAAVLVISAKMMMDYNEALNEQKKKLALIEELELERDELLYEKECEFDREYVIRIAREELGLVLPQEITYYYDYGENKQDK